MPIITTSTVDGFVSCVDPLCDAYEQRPVQIVQELAQWTYGQLGGGRGDGDPRSAMIADLVERSSIRHLPLDGAPLTCELCGAALLYDAQERPVYENLSGQDPLEVARRQRGLVAAESAVTAQERQALALEALVAQGAATDELEQLRRRVAELENGNGNGAEPPSPRTPKGKAA